MHIWTFTAAHSEIDSSDACRCGNRTNPPDILPYVGNSDQYCESAGAGAGYSVNNIHVLHTDDPLWDGEGCDPGRECECTRNSPPWFMAQLPTSTTNDIEVRNCAYGSTAKNVLPMQCTTIEFSEILLTCICDLIIVFCCTVIHTVSITLSIIILHTVSTHARIILLQ